MIFTVGRTAVYDPYIRDEPNAAKLGRGKGYLDEDYAGGSVWQTCEAAEAYLDLTKLNDEFSVYGVLADWETQTEPEPGETWHRLLITSKLVKLDSVGDEEEAAD